MIRVNAPKYLHLPPQVLWFDLEDIQMGVGMYAGYLMLGHWILLVATLPMMIFFRHLKKSKPRGFVSHFLFGIGLKRLNGYPSASTRVFHE